MPANQLDSDMRARIETALNLPNHDSLVLTETEQVDPKRVLLGRTEQRGDYYYLDISRNTLPLLILGHDSPLNFAWLAKKARDAGTPVKGFSQLPDWWEDIGVPCTPIDSPERYTELAEIADAIHTSTEQFPQPGLVLIDNLRIVQSPFSWDQLQIILEEGPTKGITTIVGLPGYKFDDVTHKPEIGLSWEFFERIHGSSMHHFRTGVNITTMGAYGYQYDQD